MANSFYNDRLWPADCTGIENVAIVGWITTLICCDKQGLLLGVLCRTNLPQERVLKCVLRNFIPLL